MMSIEWVANQIIIGNTTYTKAILFIKACNMEDRINELDEILKIKGFSKLIKKEDE